jgi:flagellar basal body-associated protein FliL
MILILLSLIVTVAMIAVAISMMRHRSSSGSLIRSGIAKEDFSITGKSAEQSATPDPAKPFLAVVLPDGTIVSQRVAAQV